MPLPTIPSGNVASALPTGFNVANSCRFNDGDSAYMHKTPGSAGSLTTWTLSVWLKRGNLGAEHPFFSGADPDGATDAARDLIRFNSDDTLNIYINGTVYRTTNRKFRDVSAWYHIVVNWDTTNGTAGLRVKLYVNGTEETSFGTSANPSSSAESNINRDTNQRVGQENAGVFYDGYMAEVCFIDGTIYAASSFGEFDEDSPTIFKPIDVSGLTFGTNGFYLDFEDSANLGNDANGGTDLTEVNLAAADQATDTPTNNFATLNPLDNYWCNGALSQGNCRLITTSAEYGYITGTLGASSGKWYWEMFMEDPVDTTNYVATGIAGRAPVSTEGIGYETNGVAYQGNDGKSRNENTISTYGDSYTTNDIIGVAMDLDNSKLYFSKNNTWQNSGDPTSGATGTGAISIDAANTTVDGFYRPAVSDHAGSSWTTATFGFNFGGCAAFTVSSAANDGNGYGNFEYAPPSGYLALCTKNLGSDGG